MNPYGENISSDYEESTHKEFLVRLEGKQYRATEFSSISDLLKKMMGRKFHNTATRKDRKFYILEEI